MWPRIQIRAAQGRTFWTVLQVWRHTRFSLRKRVLFGSEKYVAANTSKSIVFELTKITFTPFVFALGSAWALLMLEVYLPPISAKWAQWMPLPLWNLANNDSYATLLGTISGIGGVLIGLYYTGLTAASSAAYSRAPGVLLKLLLREPIGRFYIRLLAYVTFVSLCLLAFYAIGFSPIRLAIPFLIVLSGITILSFVKLGEHAFYFFDPTRLASSIFADLERWMTRATTASPFWADVSFQYHANRQADSTLKALATLAAYSAGRRQLKTESNAELAVSTVRLLYRYQSARQQIPSGSKWYPSQYTHPDFYGAGDLKVQFATETGGSVEPISVPQANWIETACVVLPAKTGHLN